MTGVAPAYALNTGGHTFLPGFAPVSRNVGAHYNVEILPHGESPRSFKVEPP
jgi:hypothetical protein